MNLLKTTIPTFFSIGISVLVYFYYGQLPTGLQQMAPFLPHFMGAALLILALYFNTAQLFYLTVVVFSVWLTITHDLTWLPDDLLVLSALGITLLVLLIPERGLISWAAWPIHLTSFGLVGLTIGMAAREPALLNQLLSKGFWPDALTPSSSLSPSIMMVLVLAMLGLLIWVILKQRALTFVGLMVLLVIITLQLTQDPTIQLLAAINGLLVLLFHALGRAWQLAYVDELTDLPGRRALEEKLQRSLGIYALAMVDVDHFKKFNDTYGHDVGDDVLRMIAAKIGDVTGGGQAYRYGGEEFTIVFSNHGADEVKSHLQDLIQAVADTPFVVNRRKGQKPKDVQVTISIGLTDSIHKANAAETIKTADQALYTAKKKGRNRLQLKN